MEKSLYSDENITEIDFNESDDWLEEWVDIDSSDGEDSKTSDDDFEIVLGEADSDDEYYSESSDENESKTKSNYIIRYGSFRGLCNSKAPQCCYICYK